MEHDSLEILACVIADKRQTDLKSPNMEVKTFEDALEYLLKKDFKVVEVGNNLVEVGNNFNQLLHTT